MGPDLASAAPRLRASSASNASMSGSGRVYREARVQVLPEQLAQLRLRLPREVGRCAARRCRCRSSLRPRSCRRTSQRCHRARERERDAGGPSARTPRPRPRRAPRGRPRRPARAPAQRRAAARSPRQTRMPTNSRDAIASAKWGHDASPWREPLQKMVPGRARAAIPGRRYNRGHVEHPSRRKGGRRRNRHAESPRPHELPDVRDALAARGRAPRAGRRLGRARGGADRRGRARVLGRRRSRAARRRRPRRSAPLPAGRHSRRPSTT